MDSCNHYWLTNYLAIQHLLHSVVWSYGLLHSASLVIQHIAQCSLAIQHTAQCSPQLVLHGQIYLLIYSGKTRVYSKCCLFVAVFCTVSIS